jgi:hypothetical protein
MILFLLTIRLRSPLAPLRRGGLEVPSNSLLLRGFRGIETQVKTRAPIAVKVPLVKGDLGGSKLR